MLGSCHHQQQIVSILSTSSGRQQNFQNIPGDGDTVAGDDDDNKLINNLMNKNNNHTNMITTIARTAINMDQRPSQLQNQQQQPPLKCPRCDSTNTKFCYYNNYSLSQPRHFCKACKRYWTRGGTLRNVPVGGGCRRKNKRINNKRIFSSSSSSSNTSTLPDIGTSTYPTFRGGTSTSSPSHFVNNSTLLYGLPTNYLPSSGDAITNFPFSSNYDMNPSSISSSTGVELLLGYNHQKFPGFSTSNPKQIIQDLISSNPNSSTFGSNTSHPSSSPSPTTSNISLYPHTLLQQHKFNFQPNFPNHSTHHDESLRVQYPKENDDDNLDQARPSFDHADPVNNMSHSGYHHQYTNLMDPNHHQQQHEYTSISWNNHDNNAPGDGTTSVGGGHHLGTNDNNWLDPTYSAAIETSSSSIPS